MTQGDAALTITATGPDRAHDVPLSLLAMGLPGALDKTFGAGGTLRVPVAADGEALAIQPDGKVVIAGWVTEGANPSDMVTRYLPDGTLDASFATNGMQLLNFTVHVRPAIALQLDGKIVVAETTGGRTPLPELWRLNAADGSPDNDFGTGGQEEFDLSDPGAQLSTILTSVFVQSDGNIIVAGNADVMLNGSLADQAVIAQFTPKGALDLNFGTAGRTFTGLGFSTANLLALAQQPGGGVAAIGQAGPSRMAAFARFTPQGNLDASFVGGGFYSLGFGSTSGTVAAMTLEPDGKLIAVGAAGGTYVARLIGDSGGLDPGFGTDGVYQVMQLGSGSFPTGVAVQPDGKYVIVGNTGPGGGRSPFIARIYPNQIFDVGFGNAGVVMPVTSGTSSQFQAVALDSDGRIVVTGGPEHGFGFGYPGPAPSVSVLAVEHDDGMAMRRGQCSGLLLVALTSCGFPKPPDIVDGGGIQDSLAVTLDAPRVRIRTGATATIGVKLTRNSADGPVAVSVGGLPSGVTADPLTIDVDENTGTLTFRSVPAATQGDTTLTVTASTPTQSHDVALSLLTMGPPGTLDPSFGVGGMAAISRGGHGDAILTQPDGKILISGVAVAADGAKNIMAARYLPNGSIDGSFAGGMVLLVAPPTLTTRVSLALQPDGKIVIASTSGIQGVVDRLNSNGSHDDGFGAGGEQLFKAGTAQSTNLAAVAVQPAGGIVLAGDADGQALVARLTATGMLDANFNIVGYTAVPDVGANARFLAVALQSDMHIVAAGFGTPAGSRTLTGFARLDPAGHLDSGFHGNGSLVIDSCAGIDFTTYASIALQQDSKIVAVGGSNSVSQGAGSAVRLAASGSPDLAFGTDGRTLVALDSFTSAMVLQPDGKLVVAGGMLINGVQSSFIARYQNNAGPDSNFGAHGSTAVTLAGSSQFGAITLDSDDRILATGFVVGSPDQILLCRFWP